MTKPCLTQGLTHFTGHQSLDVLLYVYGAISAWNSVGHGEGMGIQCSILKAVLKSGTHHLIKTKKTKTYAKSKMHNLLSRLLDNKPTTQLVSHIKLII